MTHTEEDFVASVNRSLEEVGLGQEISNSVPVKEKKQIDEPEAYQWPDYPLGILQIEVGLCQNPEKRNYKCIQRVKLTPAI